MKSIIAILPLLFFAGTCLSNGITFTELPDETIFIETAFCAKWFATIPDWGQAAEAFDLQSIPHYYRKRYLFSDGILIIEGHSTECAVTIFTPGSPVSAKQALITGAVLSRGIIPEFFSRDTEVILYEDTSDLGSGLRLLLQLDETGMITEIKLVIWTP